MAILFAVTALIGVAFGCIGGSIFDAVMGTQLLPLFVFGGLMGTKLEIVESSSTGGSEFGKKFFNFLIVVTVASFVVMVLVALVLAKIAYMFAPQDVEAILAWVGFDGSLYVLAFWVCAVCAAIRLATRSVCQVAGFAAEVAAPKKVAS